MASVLRTWLTLAMMMAPAVSAQAATEAAEAATEPAGLDSIRQAVVAGNSEFNLRYRYEFVDQDGFDDNAGASTLRTRFTWTSGTVGAIDVGFEADYVSVIGPERYDSTENGEIEYPVVADPEGFDLNQAFVRYTTDELTATGGRQRILHDNQRFVGGVGWRQNEQTYDAVRVTADPAGTLTLDYAYVANVNRIFGPNDGTQPADWRSDSHLFTSAWAIVPEWQVGAYLYLLDFENDNGPANSTATYGIRTAGAIGPLQLSASIARQSDYASSPLDYSADYVAIDATIEFEPVTATVGYERLGSDDGAAGFRTPLATLHKFQGWADQFLSTPDNGVRDVYLGIAGQAGPLTLSATYHEFRADQGGADYGSEIDLGVSYPLAAQASIEFNFADYRADAFATDTMKAWLTLVLAI